MVTVRPAAPADADEVAWVHIRSWQDAYAGIVPDDVLAALDGQHPQRAARMRERWTAEPRRFRTIVAVDSAEAVAGFATFGPSRLDPAGDRVDETRGEVLAIYVDPSRKRGGVGRALMDAAVGSLRGTGVAEVVLWVLEENAPARRFYERYGYAADGGHHLFRLERPGGGTVELPEVRYALPLTAP